jgi:hypothetical protein
MSGREAQEKLVQLLQPLAGGETRAWTTPNPWNGGRLCRRKADQDALLALSGKLPSRESVALRRLRWAEHRRDERLALVAARQRVEALKAAPPKIRARPEPPPSPCERCSGQRGRHYRNFPRFVDGMTSIPCEDCNGGVVSPSNPTYNWARRNLCDSCYAKGRSLGWV